MTFLIVNIPMIILALRGIYNVIYDDFDTGLSQSCIAIIGSYIALIQPA